MKEYIIFFFDKTHIRIDEEDAMKVRKGMSEKIQFVSLKKGIYAVSSIAKFEECRKEKLPQLEQSNPKPVSQQTLVRLRKQFAKKYGWPDKKS